MVLHHSSFNLTPNSLMKKLTKLLNLREEQKTEGQKLLLNQRVQQKMEEAKNQSQFVHKLLVLRKTWNGSAHSRLSCWNRLE